MAKHTRYLFRIKEHVFETASCFFFWVLNGLTVLLFLAVFSSFLRAEDATIKERVVSTKNKTKGRIENEKEVLQKEFLAKAQKALGVKSLGGDVYQVGVVMFDSKKKEIIIPAKVNMPRGFVEYALVHSKGKVHESIFVTDAEIEDIHSAILLLTPRNAKGVASNGIAMEVKVEWNLPNEKKKSYLLLDVVNLADGDRKNSAINLLPKNTWRYKNSMRGNRRNLMSGYDGSVIALVRDRAAMINNVWLKDDPKNAIHSKSDTSSDVSENEGKRNIYGDRKAKEAVLPPKNTPVTIKLEIYQRKPINKKQ